MRNTEEGKVGWILLWALGVPIPILVILFVLRGCTWGDPQLSQRSLTPFEADHVSTGGWRSDGVWSALTPIRGPTLQFWTV